MQDQKFLFVNIYAPNKLSEQTLVFDQIKDELDNGGIFETLFILITQDYITITLHIILYYIYLHITTLHYHTLH